MKSCLAAFVGLTFLCPASHAVPERGQENITDLITALRSRHSKDRYAAAVVLGRMGPQAKAAVPALAEARKDADAKVRRAAVEALGDIDPSSPEVLSSLVGTLKDPQPQVQHAAALALLDAGRQNKRVAPAVSEVALKEKDWQIRLLAIDLLMELQPSNPYILPTLLEGLKSKNKGVSNRAYWSLKLLDAKILKKLGPQVKAILPLLEELLKDDRPSVREAASLIMGYAGPAAESAVPVLRRALKDKEKEVRQAAAMSLGHLGGADKTVIPALIEVLKHDEDVEVWATAGSALAEIGPPAVPALVELLKDRPVKERSILIRSYAACAVGKIGPRAKEAVPVLEKTLKDKRAFPRDFESYRLDYAEALWKIDPENKLPVAVAVEILMDKELSQRKDFFGKRSFIARQAREQAIKLLGEIGSRAKAAVAALSEALKDEEWTTRGLAATALGKIGPQAQASAPALVAVLQDETRYVRIDAAEALAKVAPKRRTVAVEALVEILKDETQDLHVQLKAAEALRKLDPNHKAVGPALVRVAKNTDRFHQEDRKEALKALATMGPKAQATVPDLADIIEGQKGEQKEELGFVRLEAITALNQIGLKESVVPALVKALEDHSSFFELSFPGATVRREAALSLGRLGPAAKTAVPALTKALLDESKPVRTAAAKALEQIQGRE